MLALSWGQGFAPRWLGKHTLFKPPFGRVMRALGGIPVNRANPGRLVDEVVALAHGQERFILVVTPEGTRHRGKLWKSGFYRTRGRQPPGRPRLRRLGNEDRRIRTHHPLTGDVTADMEVPRLLRRQRGINPDDSPRPASARAGPPRGRVAGGGVSTSSTSRVGPSSRVGPRPAESGPRPAESASTSRTAEGCEPDKMSRGHDTPARRTPAGRGEPSPATNSHPRDGRRAEDTPASWPSTDAARRASRHWLASCTVPFQDRRSCTPTISPGMNPCSAGDTCWPTASWHRSDVAGCDAASSAW